MGFAVVSSLGLATIFAYIAGSPFVLQDIYGLSAQTFGLVFAMNGAALVIGAQINGPLVRRVGSSRLLNVGLAAMGTGSLIFLGAVGLHRLGLAAVLPSLPW